MARVTHVKAAQQRYRTVPVLNPDGTQKTVVTSRTTKSGREVVRRLTVEDRSQPLPPHTCEKCGAEISVGSPYKWVAPKSGPYGGYKRFRCGTCPSWRQSELSSSHAAILMAATEEFDDAIGGAESKEDIQSLLEDVASAAREVMEAYTESADNMEEGFGHETSSSSDLRDRASEFESFADEVEQALDSADDEPTVDHQVFNVYNVSDGSLINEDGALEDEDEAQQFVEQLIESGAVDSEDEVEVRKDDADEPNEEETDAWLESLREMASDAVGEAPF